MSEQHRIDRPERLPQRLHGLLRPVVYPHRVDAVQLIETQLSWVLIAGERAYKIKRPVSYPFVDFSTLELRRHFCLEELRLNRRFAPQLYLEVCTITGVGEEARIGGTAAVEEYAVVLRAFDRREELDRLVRDQRVSEEELAGFGRRLADIHERLPRSGAGSGQPERVAAAVSRNVAECAAIAAAFGSRERVARIGALMDQECARLQPDFARRARQGCIRECHGDLHLSNVVRIDGKLVPFDCLEFQPAFRHIDVAQDVAFMIADLHGYGQPLLANAFLNGWLAATGDYDACVVMRLYEGDRALVRAKVMALLARVTPPPAAQSLQLLARRHASYLEVAERALAPAPSQCIMMYGLPGSGKSWLAARLARELAAVHVSSDHERKRLAGLQPLDHSHSPLDQGLYTAARTADVYERLSQCAAAVLAGQRTVIVDANFGLRQQRDALSEVCRRRGMTLQVVSCDAPEHVLRERIRTRLAGTADSSEANTLVLERQQERREAVTSEELLNVIRADTTRPDVLQQVCAALRQSVSTEA